MDASPGPLPLAHLPYEEQLTLRRARVAEAFARGRLPVEPAPIVPSPRITGARARVQLHAARDGRLGFFAPRSHELLPVDLSAYARPELVAAAAAVEAVLRDTRTSFGGTLELRSDGERVVAVFEQRPAALERLAAVLPALAVGGRRIQGDTRLVVDGLRISHGSFFQVNLEVNRLLVEHVDRWLAELVPARLLDLYAGVGNLSARAVRRGVPATLVESDPSSSADAAFNLPGAEVRKADAGRFTPGSAFFDVALLDPPRAGAPGLLPKLAVTRPRALLYVSCDPVTLARDLGTLLPLGYRVAELTPYDMFPGTDHVESFAVVLRTR